MPWNGGLMVLVGVLSIAVFNGSRWTLSKMRKSREDYRHTLMEQIRSELRPEQQPTNQEPEQSKIVPPTNGHNSKADDILVAILNGQREGLRFQAEQVKLLRRLNGVFKGESYDDVDDQRATEIEDINALMERYGITRAEAAARVAEQRVYTKQDFGMGGR